MKQSKLWIAILLGAFGLNACSGMVKTIEVTRVVEVTRAAGPMETATEGTFPTPGAEGGFVLGAWIDPAALPALPQVPSGGELLPCFSESSEPSINWGYAMPPSHALCLNNFPTAPDSPDVTVTLVDPSGRTFQESFRYEEGDLLNSRGRPAGYIREAGEIDGSPLTAGLEINLYLPASLPCGTWMASASTQDGTIRVPPTALASSCVSPLVSALPDLSVDPFVSPDTSRAGPAFTTKETIYVVGAGYPANTAVTVAFYQDDPAAGKSESGFPLATAKYAVLVMTDAAGSFQAPFIVGSATQRGAYYTVAEPALTSKLGLSHFSTRFSIR